MLKEVINPEGALPPAAPISQAIKTGNLIFVSGQVAEDLETGLPHGGSISVQTAKALDNIARILAAAGSSLGDVVKVNAFLADINDFEDFNEAYRAFFPNQPPARSTIQAARLAGPFLVEIEAIATVP